MLGQAADFSHSRAVMKTMGAVYRALREAAPGLVIDVVDPRNSVWLYPSLWRAARRHGQSIGRTLGTLVRAGAPAAVILDGEVLFSGQLPEPDTMVATILEKLHGQLEV